MLIDTAESTTCGNDVVARHEAIRLVRCHDAEVTANHVRAPRGLVLDGSSEAAVRANTFVRAEVGVTANQAATGVVIGRNRYDECARDVIEPDPT